MKSTGVFKLEVDVFSSTSLQRPSLSMNRSASRYYQIDTEPCVAKVFVGQRTTGSAAGSSSSAFAARRSRRPLPCLHTFWSASPVPFIQLVHDHGQRRDATIGHALIAAAVLGDRVAGAKANQGAPWRRSSPAPGLLSRQRPSQSIRLSQP